LEIKHKIWLEIDGKAIFGSGRQELLRAIDECGSLNSAAKKLSMSYRAAWGRLKNAEERMGLKLVQSDGTAGMHLTEEARAFLAKFDYLERETDNFIKDISNKLSFPSKK
jgi:molybdate transport system regulatory protein